MAEAVESKMLHSGIADNNFNPGFKSGRINEVALLGSKQLIRRLYVISTILPHF